ncbi:hypothetical protein SAMN03080617_02093 [Algoriphagus alkaliphilus]|uniref:PIN domain-containing protein n=1 Tax=Algoriphagus alkaliphilus TaxID=279824 RepID=A0A1G5XXW7_9BACT|nr:type II toxin-antitoxin system VapC family toxin [Algoriphagus alkaliphilus]MBA4301006.1 hypothetical protein [Cyclobacterium sp.]SDA75040.1 hypothetical protein SAMN03080617_02093 [Algoriphagus alkaliphilus]
MRIFLNDANILIDLVHLDCVEAFFQLNVELCTTDFVLEELEEFQKDLFQNDRLRICTSDSDAIATISDLMEANPGLSFEDCSVWHHARIQGGILITGDGRLRRKASAEGIEVRGIIYLIDLIKDQGIRSISECVSILDKLKVINPRLPIHELEKRIENWRRELS